MASPKSVAITASVVAAVLLSPGVALAASNPSQQDITWMKTSAAGDLFEIEGGKLAQTHAHSAAVKQFGARLESDHTKSSADMKKLAAQLKVTLPTAPDSKERAELKQLASLHGAAFDKQYVKTEISDHKMDISDAKKEISTGSNPQVIKEARKDLPVLQTHLRLAEQTQSKTG
jgi:putative membrane protein